MDFQQNNPYTNNSYPPTAFKPNGDRLATAAMITGILSVVMLLTAMVYLSLIFGSIGIVLALLSKGHAPRLASKAKIGIICAAAGTAFTFVLCAATIKTVYTNPEIMEQANDYFEKQYGMSYEELIELFINGGDFPDEFPIQ